MNEHSVGEAFSTGIGLAIGLITAQYVFQTLQTQKVPKQVVVCLKCGGKNSVENKFCWQCGQALYPPKPVDCPACRSPMPPDRKFCGRCGFHLKNKVKTGKKRS